MEGNIECNICFENKKLIKVLECNHELCFDCYKLLINPSCPFCRHDIKLISSENIPNMSINNFDFTNFQSFQSFDDINFRRVRRNMHRNRRRNLSFDEVLDRRNQIKKKCKMKWERKNGRLMKIKFYEI